MVTSVIVQMDNSWGWDIDDIITDANAQDDNIAKKSRADAETWYYSSVSRDDMHKSIYVPLLLGAPACSDFLIWVEQTF